MIIDVFPTGTTWMQEIVFLVMSEGDFDCLGKETVFHRTPHLELDATGLPFPAGYEMVTSMPRPRRIKTHLYSNFFQVKCRNHNHRKTMSGTHFTTEDDLND